MPDWNAAYLPRETFLLIQISTLKMITGQKSNYSKPRLTKTTKAFSVFWSTACLLNTSLWNLAFKVPKTCVLVLP